MIQALTDYRQRVVIAVITRILIFSAASSLVLAAGEESSPNSERWKEFNLNTVEHYVLPRYDALYYHANKLSADSVALCTGMTTESLITAQESFKSTMSAWQSIQNIRFGPIEISERHYSLQYWPDKKNHIGKRLAQLLAKGDSNELSQEKFSGLPVSVKGLPAAERLLFDNDALTALKANPFKCQVLVRITDEISAITADLSQEWRAQMMPQFLDATQLDGYFEDDIDAATTLLKALVEPIEHMHDLKIKRPMASDLAHVKAKRLESWRSGLSKQNLSDNLASLKQLYTLAGTLGQKHSIRSLLMESAGEIDKLFDAAQSSLSEVGAPLSDSISSKGGYQAMTLHAEALLRLHKKLEQSLTEKGIHLGFNSRDGD